MQIVEQMNKMEIELENLREYFRTGKTKEATWRFKQLKGLQKFIIERERDILRALKLDVGKHPTEGYKDEIGVLNKDINAALDNLTNWMCGKKIKLPLAAFPTKAQLVPEPLGLVLVIAAWNLPFGLSLEPLIGAIAAGNTAVLKPSDLAPATSTLLAEALPTYLDRNAVMVVQGGPDVVGNLLQFKWDKIFFTGSYRVGRIIMEAAAKHLTPITLELGGKSPAIVDSLPKSWRREVMLKRLVSGKFGTCNAQACISVDYILVEKKYCSTLVNLLKIMIKNMFGEFPCESSARIINKHHLKRLENLLDESGVRDSIVYGGSVDEDKMFMEPTILVDPPLDATIMKEEIFGPLLPVITLDNIQESIRFINSRPKPLAIYCFTHDDKLMLRCKTETSSGSLMFNDTVIQYVAESIPFGGVGASGFGRYHGKYSFDTFSHEKSVIKRTYFPDFWFRYPPWNSNKLEILRAVYVYKYWRILLLMLGLIKPTPLPSDI